MSWKKFFRNILFRSTKGKTYFYYIRIVRERIALKTKTDEEFIKTTYRKRFEQEINLKNPQTFAEKLQWLKLFYRHDAIPDCTDKYEVRNYLKKQGLGYLCNELIGVYNDAKKIDFDSLPNSFAAKATHGSSWNLICKDKTQLNWKENVRMMNAWLKLNLYAFGREWNYKEITPRIIIEKYLDHEPLNDYKFMCFNGEPLYMQLNNDYDGKHYVDFYDLQSWEHLSVTYQSYKISDRIVEKPEQFEKMMELAIMLSKPFPFVRIDFYNFDEKIIFGELTFFPGGGLWPFIPMELGYNEKLGEKLQLPEANYNMELYQKINKE